ncbi:MAG: mechanosensitive ion channel [Algibacter sp.]|uniref:mechanosensitive ion channel family protein n=1 Tax=Algibacter sp. TaxID=1872428 RepID=UPI002603543A|nr:mechanosensitive ion channel domain-containing protein [Algibacter sp.]MDG1730569.1 mechanosensitive ion channel [Algibacter sp.]MDG2177546.1 mechanosensitive ion channel [Algibacter sp.]
MNLENINTEKWLQLALDYGLKILGAILIWIIGSWVIKKILKTTKKIMSKRDYDESLQKFLLNLLGWILKIILIVVLLGTIGVETTSFAAILAAAGLAIGLALQGSLGNFAGGVLLMIFKPIKIGDLIEAQGEIGVVKEIEIFTTKLTGLSNREIIIPNGSLSNGNIINYTTEGTRRVDLTFGVGYDSDIKKTKEVLMNVLTSHPKVLKSPAPTVNVSELADSSINFAVRPWSTSDDYWDVYFGITEDVKEALDKAGIEIPYPHQVEIRKNA